MNFIALTFRALGRNHVASTGAQIGEREREGDCRHKKRGGGRRERRQRRQRRQRKQRRQRRQGRQRRKRRKRKRRARRARRERRERRESRGKERNQDGGGTV